MIEIILLLVLVGVLLYLLSLIPMDPTMLIIIRCVVIIGVIFWLIQTMGLFDLPPLRIRHF